MSDSGVDWRCVCEYCLSLFLVKQKTAYEMRISDWSSDVCSSDLASAPPADVATLLAVSGTIELLSWWLRQSRPWPIADVVDIHTKLVLLPIIEAQQAAIRRPVVRTKTTAKHRSR